MAPTWSLSGLDHPGPNVSSISLWASEWDDSLFQLPGSKILDVVSPGSQGQILLDHCVSHSKEALVLDCGSGGLQLSHRLFWELQLKLSSVVLPLLV